MPLFPLHGRIAGYNSTKFINNLEECETAEGCIKVRAVWTAASTVTLAGLTADFVAALVRLNVLVE
jgi:hypothetical protein